MRCEVQTPGCPGDAGWRQNSEGFRASKSSRDVWSPFSHSMRRSFCQLLMVFGSCCHVCSLVKVNGFHRRFRQEQLGLLQIFGCNKRRREKRVCSHLCLPFFFTFDLDTASDAFWHRLCTDWIFSPSSFSIYESLSRQTHFLTLETKCCDKAISPGVWGKIPAGRSDRECQGLKAAQTQLITGHHCPGDVTSKSLTIRDVQTLEGGQEEQRCEHGSHPDSTVEPWSARLSNSCFVIWQNLVAQSGPIHKVSTSAQSWRCLCLHIYFKPEHKEVHTSYNYLQSARCQNRIYIPSVKSQSPKRYFQT